MARVARFCQITRPKCRRAAAACPGVAGCCQGPPARHLPTSFILPQGHLLPAASATRCDRPDRTRDAVRIGFCLLRARPPVAAAAGGRTTQRCCRVPRGRRRDGSTLALAPTAQVYVRVRPIWSRRREHTGCGSSSSSRGHTPLRHSLFTTEA
ncbi:hypothetical protein SEVIR_2G089901v4 [Setaria viridis]